LFRSVVDDDQHYMGVDCFVVANIADQAGLAVFVIDLGYEVAGQPAGRHDHQLISDVFELRHVEQEDDSYD
jgi:hypothetical protein